MSYDINTTKTPSPSGIYCIIVKLCAALSYDSMVVMRAFIFNILTWSWSWLHSISLLKLWGWWPIKFLICGASDFFYVCLGFASESIGISNQNFEAWHLWLSRIPQCRKWMSCSFLIFWSSWRVLFCRYQGHMWALSSPLPIT